MRTGNSSLKERLSPLTTPILLSLVLALIALLSGAGSSSFQLKVMTMLVFCVAVVGLYVFVGNTGIVSFGHVSFMAIGAYAGALVTIPALSKKMLLPSLPGFIQSAELSPELGVIVGGLVAALFALIIAAPLMRLSGISAAIALLSVLMIVSTVLREAETITRGTKSLTGIPLAMTTGRALIWAIVAIALAYAYQRSRWGLRARATREDIYGAGAAGIYVPFERTIALVVSAAVMGAAGALYGQLLGTINPETFFLTMTIVTLVMLIVGGSRSLSGAVIGTVVVFALSELLRNIESGMAIGPVVIPERPGLELIGVSLAALAILILRPKGLMSGYELDSQLLRNSRLRSRSKVQDR